MDIRPVEFDDVGPLYAVRTTEAQQDFVAPNGITFGQAPFEPGSEIFGIWDGRTAVGLIAVIDMVHPDADITPGHDRDGIYVWRLLISADWQRKGAGTAAMQYAIDMARERGRAHVAVCCVEAPGSALPFYEKLGFQRTGKLVDSEVELVRYFDGKSPD